MSTSSAKRPRRVGERALVGVHQIAHGAHVGDHRDVVGERVGAERDLELDDEPRQHERAQAQLDELVLRRNLECLVVKFGEKLFDLALNDSLHIIIQHVIPPSMTIVCPVINDAAGELRKTTRSTTSSVVPRRPTGVRRSIRSRFVEVTADVMSLSKNPGTTELTRMFSAPSSRARLRLKPSSPALAAE